jgi:hypothetical protein
MVSWNNVSITLRESWFVLVALLAYLLLKSYNDFLDREEQKLVDLKDEADRQFAADDTDSTS